MNERDWERKLHERLRALPDRKAPPALLMTVMAQARAREAAQVGLFDRVPRWAGVIGLGLASAGALYLLSLQLGWALGALQAAAAPWLPALKGLALAGRRSLAVIDALGWDWRLPLAGLAAASLTACAGGTVAVGLLVGAGHDSWRTR
ncbi:MAG: hypothetical protein HY553_04675 [Elusimicrobia bacterium]|nr:hypothetical protein [Elusimicrobiota bacterium]